MKYKIKIVNFSLCWENLFTIKRQLFTEYWDSKNLSPYFLSNSDPHNIPTVLH